MTDVCERCNLPRIPSDAWSTEWDNAPDNMTMRAWRDSVIAKWPGHCDARQARSCTKAAIDWRGRAITAEAKLKEVDWPKIYDNAGGLRDKITTLEAQLSSERSRTREAVQLLAKVTHGGSFTKADTRLVSALCRACGVEP